MELFNLHKQQLKDFFTYNDEEEALKLSYAFMKEIALSNSLFLNNLL